MKILLLGGKGQIGWELQRSLATLADVIATDCRISPHPRMTGELPALLRAVRPDVVVNAAAYTSVDRAETESDLAMAVNAEAPALLAEEVAAHGSWLVHYGTDYVFDGEGPTPRKEDDPTGPLNVYGRSKLEGEQRIVASGCRHLIFRTSWVYASRGQNFPRTMLRLAGERDSLQVVDDQYGAPTGADLVADVTAHALRAALQRPDLAGLYHLVASGETSWHGYAAHVLRAARAAGVPLRAGPEALQPVTTSAFVTAARRPRNSRLCTEKRRRAFDLVLPDWRQGVYRMLAEVLSR